MKCKLNETNTSLNIIFSTLSLKTTFGTSTYNSKILIAMPPLMLLCIVLSEIISPLHSRYFVHNLKSLPHPHPPKGPTPTWKIGVVSLTLNIIIVLDKHITFLGSLHTDNQILNFNPHKKNIKSNLNNGRWFMHWFVRMVSRSIILLCSIFRLANTIIYI